MTSANLTSRNPVIWPRVQARRQVFFWIGCAMAALGVGAIASPALGALVIGALAGWLLWLAGAVMLGASMLLIGLRPFAGALVSSLAAIAAGMFLLFNPTVGVLAVTMLAVAVFLVDGAFQLALALDLRPLKVWRWILGSAIASLLAALLIGAGFPQSTPAFGALAGMAVLTTGLGFILLSRAAGPGRAAPPAT